jgi:hypothetical protein
VQVTVISPPQTLTLQLLPAEHELRMWSDPKTLQLRMISLREPVP